MAPLDQKIFKNGFIVMKDERPRETFIGTICYELLVLVRDDWDKADEVKKIFS